MRPRIPRDIKIKVIRLLINGGKIDDIAKAAGVGKGTVNAIKNEAREQEEYYDIDWLRQTSVMLRQEDVRLNLLSFAIRISNIMKEKGMNEDQLEIIISDIDTCRFSNNLTYEKLIECGLKALELANEFGINVELLSEYLTQAKTKLQRLEEQKQEAINVMVKAQKEADIARAERERYGGVESLIEQNRELQKEAKEARTSKQYYKERFESAERQRVGESKLVSKIQGEDMNPNRKLEELQDAKKEKALEDNKMTPELLDEYKANKPLPEQINELKQELSDKNAELLKVKEEREQDNFWNKLEQYYEWSVSETEIDKANMQLGYGRYDNFFREPGLSVANLKEMVLDVFRHPSAYVKELREIKKTYEKKENERHERSPDYETKCS